MYQFDGTNNLPPGVSHADIERAMGGEEMIEDRLIEAYLDVRAWEEDILARLEEELGREPTKEEFEEEKERNSY